jgi:glucokinase
MSDNNCLLGFELSRALARGVLLDADGNLLAQETVTPDPENPAAQIAELAGLLRGEHAVKAVGLAAPGLVNRAANRVEVSPDLPALTREGFYEELQAALDAPVWLDNDANAAAYAEYARGAGRGCRDMFYATIGAGVGGALIFGGQVWRGAGGYAGEFGHLTINVENDTTLEYMASAENIVRRTHDRLMRDSTSSLSQLGEQEDFTALDIARAANNNDDFAIMMMARTGKFIGTVLAGVINLLNIERLVIGGETARAAGNTLLAPIKHEAERLSFGPAFASSQIVAAEIGPEAAAAGAALLAQAEIQTNN